MINTKVYEGERPMTKDNHLLGSFPVEGIVPAPKGVPKIEMRFEIDENSILTVTATDTGTNKKTSITITNDKGRLTPEEIEAMVKDAEKFADADKLIKERIDSKNQLDNYIYQMKKSMSNDGNLVDKVSAEDRSTILDALTDSRDWLEANDDAEKDDLDDHLRQL